MNCSVFRSCRKEYTYIYLREGTKFADLPEALRNIFGQPEFVIDLELSLQRKLASEDVGEVIQNLSKHGFHLQLPPGNQIGDLI